MVKLVLLKNSPSFTGRFVFYDFIFRFAFANRNSHRHTTKFHCNKKCKSIFSSTPIIAIKGATFKCYLCLGLQIQGYFISWLISLLSLQVTFYSSLLMFFCCDNLRWNLSSKGEIRIELSWTINITHCTLVQQWSTSQEPLRSILRLLSKDFGQKTGIWTNVHCFFV